MSGETNKLVGYAEHFSSNPARAEMDMLLSSGERVTSALLSIALNEQGYKATSMSGREAGILTCNAHTKARIENIDVTNMKKAIGDGKVIIVAGFQGVTANGRVSTLGRGGSDLTAVAIAGAIHADICEIYTDVDGIYTTDPRIEPKAKKLDKISYDEMLELSNYGAQVLHPRASSIAARFKIPVEIRNSFNNKTGTLITNIAGTQRPRPKAITHSTNLYHITLVQVPKRNQYLSQIVTELTKGGVHLKFFSHGVSDARKFDLSFITPLDEKDKVKSIINTIIKKLDVDHTRESSDICSLSVIGKGIGSANKIISDIFNILSKLKEIFQFLK